MSVWEPTIGQRVRVLPRPACRYCQDGDGGRDDGAVGVVVQVGHDHRDELAGPDEDEAELHAHRVWVRLDAASGGPPWADHFRPDELEPA
jgi:hypothetical protein